MHLFIKPISSAQPFRSGRALALLIALLSALAPPAGADPATRELPPAAVFGRVAPSIVVIEAALKDGSSQGSGVVIAPELIVTNHHVIKGAATVQVRQGERHWVATLEALEPQRDLALLRVKGLDLPRVAMRPSSLVTVGERVYAVGAPRGLELSLSDGLLSALRRESKSPAEAVSPNKAGSDAAAKVGGDTAAVLQTTAPVSPGSSGGGLFDAQARLIGIMTFTATGGQNLNFAHPTEWIEALRAAAPASASAAAVATKPPPRYGLMQRPWGLRCHLNTRSIWGVFSGGSEMLESKPTRAEIELSFFEKQTPQLQGEVDGEARLGELVLSDLNREAGFIAFSPSYDRDRRRSYFFSVDDDGQFRLTTLTAFEFRGQPRISATAGPCDAVDAASKITSAPDPEERCKSGDVQACISRAETLIGRDRTGALRLYLRGCDLAEHEKTRDDGLRACGQAAKLCEQMGFTLRAAELRSRITRLQGKP